MKIECVTIYLAILEGANISRSGLRELYNVVLLKSVFFFSRFRRQVMPESLMMLEFLLSNMHSSFEVTLSDLNFTSTAHNSHLPEDIT